MESLDEFDFPDYEIYKANLASLDRFDFNKSSTNEIYHKYFDLALTIPFCYKFFKPNEFNKMTFYRARINVDQTKEDISLISTFSFPPPVFCNENGRANLKTKSVFYCSDNPISAIKECRPNNDEEGFVGIWRTKTNRDIKSCIFLPRNLTKENKWSDIAKKSFKNFSNDLLFKKVEKRQAFKRITSFCKF